MLVAAAWGGDEEGGRNEKEGHLHHSQRQLNQLRVSELKMMPEECEDQECSQAWGRGPWKKKMDTLGPGLDATVGWKLVKE